MSPSAEVMPKLKLHNLPTNCETVPRTLQWPTKSHPDWSATDDTDLGDRDDGNAGSNSTTPLTASLNHGSVTAKCYVPATPIRTKWTAAASIGAAAAAVSIPVAVECLTSDSALTGPTAG
jgi:hypothetical protein